MKADIFAQCQAVFPDWANRSIDDFGFNDPKGFSSFMMGIRCQVEGVRPTAVLYRQLEGKENAILDSSQSILIFGLQRLNLAITSLVC